MLALLRMAEPSVRRTPKILTPRLGHVRELCPLWLQCEHRRVIAAPRRAAPASGSQVGLARAPRSAAARVGRGVVVVVVVVVVVNWW
jgi:hypothetical protein